MKVLVGSQAAAINFPGYRKPKDVDYFSDARIEGAETFYHPYLEGWAWGDVATADELYTIKVSHSFWPNRWPKHIQDIAWMQEHGAKLIPELYDLLYLIWVEHYGRKRARLPKGATADTFFTGSVERKYDHDSIHASVAYYNEPLYKAILADGEQVAVDRAKFESLSHLDKLRLAREEMYATALERILIPDEYTSSSLRAYRWSLQQTVTSFSKGWFPLFIVENARYLLRPEIDYVQRHRDNCERLIVLEK